MTRNNRRLQRRHAGHDVARRVDCAFLAELIAIHQLEEDEARDCAHALSYGLAKSAYGF